MAPPPRGTRQRHADAEFTATVGERIRRLRAQADLSLEQLSTRSGVSRAMLSQIELGRSVPTITVLSRIAEGLDVATSALLAASSQPRVAILRREAGKQLQDPASRVISRALFPFERARKCELYEMRLQPDSCQSSGPHQPGTTENLVVASGRLAVEIEGMSYELGEGDALFFSADVPHAYRNPGAGNAVIYLVMNYPEAVNS